MESILTANPLKSGDFFICFHTKEKFTSVCQPSKRSHNTGILLRVQVKRPKWGTMWISPTCCSLLLARIPAVCGLPLHYTGCRSRSELWQANTTISFEKQMPTFDIPWISCLNNESKWVYLQFVQAGACCPSAIHKHSESTIKARRKQNWLLLCSSRIGHLCSRERAGGEKQRTVCAGLTKMKDVLLFPEPLFISVRTQTVSRS